MVLIDSPSAATWTPFAALGVECGGSCCWKKLKPDGGWDPGAWEMWLHPACLSPTQAAHTVLSPWASSNARLSQGRCSSLAEMLECADLEGKESFPSRDSCLPAAMSRPSAGRQPRSRNEPRAAERMETTRGLGGGTGGLRAGRCQPRCRQPWGPRERARAWPWGKPEPP